MSFCGGHPFGLRSFCRDKFLFLTALFDAVEGCLLLQMEKERNYLVQSPHSTVFFSSHAQQPSDENPLNLYITNTKSSFRSLVTLRDYTMVCLWFYRNKKQAIDIY